MSSGHSTWPVTMCIYNLPPWLCMKRKYIIMPIIIQGPKQPGNDIDVYLIPLVEDLKLLWKKEGVPVWDEDKQEEFNLRALLFVTINDWLALSNLSGQSNKGYKACTHCMDETESTYLKHCRKVVYMGHRRFILLKAMTHACTVNVYDSTDKKSLRLTRAWYRLRHLVRGKWRERLRRKFKFPCAKQKQGTNLCGYYVCEYCHCLVDQIITTRELDFIRMRDNLITHKEFIAAVQEQLMGFINEQILDPKGEFYYDGNTIHMSLASEIATTTTSKS
uniref:OSJNBa0019J05.9 protein n=1 Tax=Oryza sativa subsp. japonica TaxID=39947 RepID=Q7XW85_ORYSJ|nr:OSJNBa0019J05.9 [Oryza sativa Japonica Group]